MIASQVWMRSEAFGSMDRWITFDIEEAAETNPELAGMGSGMNDPRAALNFLAGAERMRDSGVEQHNGETMTRYEGTVDFNKAVAAAPPEQREGTQVSFDGLATMGVTDADTTVWVDGDGYVREIRYEFAPGSSSEAAGLELTMFSTIGEIGKDLSIEPPTGDVVDLADLT